MEWCSSSRSRKSSSNSWSIHYNRLFHIQFIIILYYFNNYFIIIRLWFRSSSVQNSSYYPFSIPFPFIHSSSSAALLSFPFPFSHKTTQSLIVSNVMYSFILLSKCWSIIIIQVSNSIADGKWEKKCLRYGTWWAEPSWAGRWISSCSADCDWTERMSL